MNKCFKCGVSGDRALLFGAVSEKGIVRICRKCSFEEDIPIIKHLKEEIEKRPSVYERLSRLSKVEVKNKEEEINSQNKELGKIANDNFSKNVLEKNPFGMVENFHWIIMRARRSKKITQKQFAETIEESEEAIKMAEKGVLPKDDFLLINKIENYLSIRIKDKAPKGVSHRVGPEEGGTSTSSRPPEMQDGISGGKKSFEQEVNQVKEEFLQNVEKDKIKFDDNTTKTLTISDLQEMKTNKEKSPQAYPEPSRSVGTFPEEMFTKGKIFRESAPKSVPPHSVPGIPLRAQEPATQARTSDEVPSVDEDITLKSVPSTQEDINVEGNTEGKDLSEKEIGDLIFRKG